MEKTNKLRELIEKSFEDNTIESRWIISLYESKSDDSNGIMNMYISVNAVNFQYIINCYDENFDIVIKSLLDKVNMKDEVRVCYLKPSFYMNLVKRENTGNMIFTCRSY